MKAGTRTPWTFAIAAIGLFMVVLDDVIPRKRRHGSKGLVAQAEAA